MLKKDRQNLGYLGEDFQFKLIHTFMEERDFFKDLNPIVDQNMFTNPQLKVFVGVMKEYYEREEAVPSYSMMGIALNERSHNETEREIYKAIIDEIRKTPSDGVDYIRDLATKFFKQQNIVKTANEILRIAGDGDTSRYEQCVDLLHNALNQGTSEDLGNTVFDDLGETLSDDYRITIPTGIGKIDEALEGGLGKGELGVIIGSSSFGKAQPLSANILCPKTDSRFFNWRKMGDIKVGDEVLDRNGVDKHKVVGVFPQGIRPIYKVTCQNGASCECDIEHLWNVNGQVLTLREIMDLDYKNTNLYLPEFNMKPFLGDGTINQRLYITNIEYLRDEEAQCIMIDSEEHLYVTDNFIVTHNTSMTTAMAAHAATFKCEHNNFQGFKVLQIVFEDRIKQIQRKHIGRITGIEAKDLSKPGVIDNVRHQLETYEDREMLANNLKLVRFPSGELTASHIQRYIKKLINNGFKPDLVIIDYFECLHHIGDGHSANEYEKEGKTMRKFEAMAGELDIAFWIPTQGTRDSVNMELVTMDKAGGSFKKIQIAHIVMSIARTMEDIDLNKATIALLKNRAGKSGKVFNNVEFNNGTCRISTDNVDEFEDMLSYNKNSQKQRENITAAIFQDSQRKK